MRWKGRLAVTTLTPLPCTQPPTSHIISYARFASTSSSASSSTPFPFPTHRNPSPHQIFHLPLNASQVEIKARCARISILQHPPQLLTLSTDYELVRTFHPDSPASRALPSSVRHARFHAVSRAYDTLRGKSHARLGQGRRDDVYTAELARRRRQHAQRQAGNRGRAAPGYASEAEATSAADDAWKDQLIIIVGLAVRTVCFLSSHCDSPSLDPQSIVVGLAPALLSLHTIPDARHRAASANLAQARAEARTFGDERRAAIRARVAEFGRSKGDEDSPS